MTGPGRPPDQEVSINKTSKVLLLIDGAVNLILGAVLLSFPTGIQKFFGLPRSDTPFYASLLGAVLFGIGLALWIERFGGPFGIRGLGLGGAIAINICGASVLMIWLTMKKLDIPPRGVLILWSVAVVVLLIGFAEILTKSYRAK
jgi:hypothetical protein